MVPLTYSYLRAEHMLLGDRAACQEKKDDKSEEITKYTTYGGICTMVRIARMNVCESVGKAMLGSTIRRIIKPFMVHVPLILHLCSLCDPHMKTRAYPALGGTNSEWAVPIPHTCGLGCSRRWKGPTLNPHTPPWAVLIHHTLGLGCNRRWQGPTPNPHTPPWAVPIHTLRHTILHVSVQTSLPTFLHTPPHISHLLTHSSIQKA